MSLLDSGKFSGMTSAILMKVKKFSFENYFVLHTNCIGHVLNARNTDNFLPHFAI
jgi:hypothetical protein